MSCYTTYLDNKLLDAWIGNSAYTPPGTVYIALSTTTPTQAGGNFTEPAGNGYARVAVTNNLTNWPAASNGAKNNANQINFPQASGNWGTITNFGIYDAPSGGNLLAFAPLSQQQTIINGDTPYFPAGSLALNIA